MLALGLVVAFIGSAFAADLPNSGAERFQRWALREKAKIEGAKTDLDRREAGARRALTSAQQALTLARQTRSPEAEVISREAIARAEAALAQIATQRQREQERATALDRAIERFRQGRTLVGERSPLSAVAGLYPAAIRGTVLRTTSQGTVPLRSDTVLEVGDSISTGSDGSVRLTFLDGSHIRLGRNTVFEYTGSNELHSTFDFLRGRGYFRFDCKARGSLMRQLLTPREELEHCSRIKLPTAVLTVRGTEIALDAPETGPSTLIVLEGEVEVTRGGTSVVVKTGQVVTISPTDALGNPVAIDMRRVNKWWE